MVRLLFLFTALTLATAAVAQRPAYPHQGMLQATATLSSGLRQGGITTVYLQGNIEYFVLDRLSWRGDGFYHFSSPSGETNIDFNHQVFSGAFYHFGKNQLDPYVGFEPGISISRREPINGERVPKTVVSPTAAAVTGLNYYARKYFLLFIEARYITGREAAFPNPESLNEFRFSFGLGFHLF